MGENVIPHKGLYIALLKPSSVFAETAAKKTISARSGDGKSRGHQWKG
ncbi:MAG: hypothetical protein IKV89_03790 [Clostridia bacterium]|nr:hypothetical protein [Clostridia bacterium]